MIFPPVWLQWTITVMYKLAFLVSILLTWENISFPYVQSSLSTLNTRKKIIFLTNFLEFILRFLQFSVRTETILNQISFNTRNTVFKRCHGNWPSQKRCGKQTLYCFLVATELSCDSFGSLHVQTFHIFIIYSRTNMPILTKLNRRILEWMNSKFM